MQPHCLCPSTNPPFHQSIHPSIDGPNHSSSIHSLIKPSIHQIVVNPNLNPSINSSSISSSVHCLSVQSSIIHLSIHLSITRLSICLSIHPTNLYLSIHPSPVYPSVHSSIRHTTLHPSAHLFFLPSIHFFMHPFNHSNIRTHPFIPYMCSIYGYEAHSSKDMCTHGIYYSMHSGICRYTHLLYRHVQPTMPHITNKITLAFLCSLSNACIGVCQAQIII